MHRKKGYFDDICAKHRLWVFVRTASPRVGSNDYPQSMFSMKNRKVGIQLKTPC